MSQKSITSFLEEEKEDRRQDLLLQRAKGRKQSGSIEAKRLEALAKLKRKHLKLLLLYQWI